MSMRYSALFAAARAKKDSPHECVALIRKAEAHAGHAQDWRLCAEAWLDCFKDADNASRCLLEAECRFYYDCRELAVCAAAWMALFHDQKAAQRCVEKITGRAGLATDWDYCAEFLMNAGSQSLAVFCLRQAEKYARTRQDWQQRAAAWRDLLQDESNSRRCAESADAGQSPLPINNDEVEAATGVIVRERRATVSYLSRRMNVSYARAACLMDELQRIGVVGPQVGAAPRKILLYG